MYFAFSNCLLCKSSEYRSYYILYTDSRSSRSNPAVFYHQISDTRNESRFTLCIPGDFSDSKIAVDLVETRNPKLSSHTIMCEIHQWLSAAFFFGAGEVMLASLREFRAALERVMEEGLMSNEQDVLYFLYNTMAPKTQLQVYAGQKRGDPWFHLAYVAKTLVSMSALAERASPKPTNYRHQSRYILGTKANEKIQRKNFRQ